MGIYGLLAQAQADQYSLLDRLLAVAAMGLEKIPFFWYVKKY